MIFKLTQGQSKPSRQIRRQKVISFELSFRQRDRQTYMTDRMLYMTTKMLGNDNETRSSLSLQSST